MSMQINENTNNIIQIRDDQIKNALQFSKKYRSYPQYSGIYNLMIGLASLENWIQQYYLPINFDFHKHSFTNESHCLFTSFISGLKLGKFQGCLLIRDDSFSDLIEIPEVAVNSPIFSAHFYLVAEIIEEIFEPNDEDEYSEYPPQVNILGFMRRDEIINLKKNIQYAEDGYYQIPIIALDPDFSNLYTYAEYLKYEKIPLALETQSVTQFILAGLKQKINRFLSKPYFTGDSIWGELGLTPEETQEFFNQESLQNQLRESLEIYIQKQTNDSLVLFKNQVINLYSWFTGELDQAAQSIGFLNPSPLNQFMTGTFFDDHQDISEQVLSELIANQEIPDENIAISRHEFFLKEIGFKLTVGAYKSSSSIYGISYILQTKAEPFFPEELAVKLSDEDGYSEYQSISSGNMYFQQTLEIEENEVLNLEFSCQDSHHKLQFCFSQIASTSRLLSTPIVSLSYSLTDNSDKSLSENSRTLPQNSLIIESIFSIISRLTSASEG